MNRFNQILALVLIAYLVSIVPVAIYFSLDYAEGHSFLEWVRWGVPPAFLKGLVWPYYLFRYVVPA